MGKILNEIMHKDTKIQEQQKELMVKMEEMKESKEELRRLITSDRFSPPHHQQIEHEKYLKIIDAIETLQYEPKNKKGEVYYLDYLRLVAHMNMQQQHQ